MVTNDEEETSHAQNNKLLIEAVTSQMTKMMDARFEKLRQESSTRKPNRERQRRNLLNGERPQEKPNWRSRLTRDEANQDYYSRDNQSRFKHAKPLQINSTTKIDYEELNKKVLETYMALKEKYKNNPSTSYSVGTKATNDKPSGLKEGLVIQKSESAQPLPICKESTVVEENDENSTEEKVKIQPCIVVQNQQHLSSKEEQTENKTLKHLASLKAKCDISSTQSDFAFDKLILFKPVQPSILECFPQVYAEKLRKTSEWLSPKAIKFKWKEKEEMNCQLTKEKFSNTLVLSDFFKSCKLEYYASRKGIGTIVMQDQKPITTFCEKDEGFPIGVTKSFKVMKDHFLWPHKKKGDVRRRCQSYVICKWTNTQPHGLHPSILIPLHSWNESSFGFAGLSRIRMGKDFFVLIMNMFSKLCYFVSFHKTSVNLHHAHLFFEGITRLNSFLKIKLVLLDAFHEFEPYLSDHVFSIEIASSQSVFNFNEAFMLFRTESKFVWYKTVSKMKLLLQLLLCAFKWFNELEKHLQSVLKYISSGLKYLV